MILGCKNVSTSKPVVEVLTSVIVLQFTGSTSLERKHDMTDGRKN
jgi:hypothetical protein